MRDQAHEFVKAANDITDEQKASALRIVLAVVIVGGLVLLANLVEILIVGTALLVIAGIVWVGSRGTDWMDGKEPDNDWFFERFPPS